MERVADGVRRIVQAEVEAKAPQSFRSAQVGHKAAAKQDKSGNGFTPKRVFRRVARVPADALRQFHAECPRGDMKPLKKVIKSGGYHTVGRGTF